MSSRSSSNNVDNSPFVFPEIILTFFISLTGFSAFFLYCVSSNKTICSFSFSGEIVLDRYISVCGLNPFFCIFCINETGSPKAVNKIIGI